MVSQQLQLIYEIEGLMLLAEGSCNDPAKKHELNLLIDSKIDRLIRSRGITEDAPEHMPTFQVCVHDESNEDIARSAEFEESADAGMNGSISDVSENSESIDNTDSVACCKEDPVADPDPEQISGTVSEFKSQAPESDDEIVIEIPTVAYSEKTGCGGADRATMRHFPFTLNDRFRFRRELFGNSDEDYRNALAALQGFPDYDAACSHFIGILGWDKESPVVIDFLEIVKNGYER